MNLAFFGTPEFAAVCLRALVASSHRVVAVVTRPDAPRGRSGAAVPSEVSAEATRAGLELSKPPNARDAALVPWLRERGAEIGAVVAYGHLLPADVLASLPRGFVNLHASLLPRHRGATPIRAALLAGDATTGVTTIQMNETLDAGDLLLAREVPISPEHDAGSLEEALAAEGASLLVETLDRLAAGDAPRTPQDASRATTCGKLRSEDERLDWSLAAEVLARRVRALAPRPGAFFEEAAIRIRVLRARAEPDAGGDAPGTVRDLASGGPAVRCGSGRLRLLRVQPAGGREMDGSDFVRGRRWNLGRSLLDSRPHDA